MFYILNKYLIGPHFGSCLSECTHTRSNGIVKILDDLPVHAESMDFGEIVEFQHALEYA